MDDREFGAQWTVPSPGGLNVGHTREGHAESLPLPPGKGWGEGKPRHGDLVGEPDKSAKRELLDRYRSAWRHAWQRRKTLDAPMRLRHEVQFLPAALALPDQPVHPVRQGGRVFDVNKYFDPLGWTPWLQFEDAVLHGQQGGALQSGVSPGF